MDEIIGLGRRSARRQKDDSGMDAQVHITAKRDADDFSPFQHFRVPCLSQTVLVGLLNAKSMADEHEAHLEHIKHENGGDLPPRIKYPCKLPFSLSTSSLFERIRC